MILKRALVPIFFALLCLPGLQMIFHVVPFVDVGEHRSLDAFPRLEPILRGDGRVASAINSWFDDHVGFRPWLIRLKNQIDYSVFSYSSKVFIGSDGWLYLKRYYDEIIEEQRLGSDQQRKIRAGLLTLRDYLAAKNIRLVIVANPTKQTIVTQPQPRDVPHLPEHSQFEEFRSFLERQQGWIYIDGEELLKRPCTTQDEFYRLDLHITAPAAACLAQTVVDSVAKDAGRPPALWLQKFEWQHEIGANSDAEARFIGMFEPLTQSESYLDHYYAGDQNIAVNGRYAVWPGDGKSGGVFEWIWHASPSARDALLPPLVMYGNSFLDLYPYLGFAEYFQDIYRTRQTNVPLSATLEHLPPGTKYFLYQFLEPEVGLFATMNDDVQKARNEQR